MRGLFLLALLVGAGSGLGAVAFRYLIYFFTWAATGHSQFGQQGHVGSAHLPWLGLGFFVVIPVAGGLLIADITAIPFLGDKPFLSGFPSGIVLHHARNYLLVAALAVVAALMGLAFKAVLYKTEDLCDLTLSPGDRVSLLTAVPPG